TTAGPCAGSYVLHRTWTASDICGNATTSALQSFPARRSSDLVLAGVPANTSADCASVPAAALVTATDNCSGVNAAGVVLSESTRAGAYAASHELHRAFAATDHCGNATTSATQDITVSDTTGPVLAGVPANTSADCASVPAAALVTATDNCSGVNGAEVVLSELTTRRACAGSYVLQRTWTAT